jgi:hypothetical protein
MGHVLAIIIGALILALFGFVVLYVTWLFVERLRKRDRPLKSFFRWVLDLLDALQGLG